MLARLTESEEATPDTKPASAAMRPIMTKTLKPMNPYCASWAIPNCESFWHCALKIYEIERIFGSTYVSVCRFLAVFPQTDRFFDSCLNAIIVSDACCPVRASQNVEGHANCKEAKSDSDRSYGAHLSLFEDVCLSVLFKYSSNKRKISKLN